MASLDEDFSEQEHPDEFELLPPGDYVAQIIQSEIKDTKSGNGRMIVFTFSIAEGEKEGRLAWARINFINPNAQAQSIGRKELGNIARAAGVSKFSDTEELHYKPLIITLGVKNDPTGQYRPQNEIKAYKPISGPGAAAGEAAPPPQERQAAPAAPSQGQAKPWQRKAA